MIIIICASQDSKFMKDAGIWVMLVSCAALLILLIMFLIYVLNVIARVPDAWHLFVRIYDVILYKVYLSVYFVFCTRRSLRITRSSRFSL